MVSTKEEKKLELHITINKEIEDYNSFCAYLTGVVGEYYEHGLDMESNKSVDKKRIYKDEESYDFEYILRKEYEGFYEEPSISEKNTLMIYLKESLKEEEIEIITRRLQVFSKINDFKIFSIKEVNRIIKTSFDDIKEINY